MTSEQFDTLYRRNYLILFKTAYSMLHDEEECRDLINDIFANLIDNPPQKEIQNIDGYLYRMVKNRALSFIEHQSAIQRFQKLYPIELTTYEYNPNHDDQLMQIIDFLDKNLTVGARETVRQVFELGHSYKEAANSMGVSVSVINTHVVRTLRLLRDKFKINK